VRTTVAKWIPHRKRFLAFVTDEGLHISHGVGDTDPFSVAEGVFGPFPMCRSVLVIAVGGFISVKEWTGVHSSLVVSLYKR
jgi:hypothetical protein